VGVTTMRGNDDLYHQALEMSVNKNLLDVTTLLEWAQGEGSPLDKARHVDRAIELLRDVRDQLIHMTRG
jgi:fatty acid-binding protein DegV